MVRNYVALLVLATFAALTLAAPADDKNATKAYELRMKGQVDEAKALLEQALVEKPDDAAAYYELARVQLHMALGDMRHLEQSIADAQQSISRAITHDPKKVMYHVFAGHVAYFRAYMALKMNQGDIREHFSQACHAYESALEIKPDYPQVLLYLVELHGQFPESAGADRSQAEGYTRKLEALNVVFAAKARSILSPQSGGVEFWKTLLPVGGTGDAEVLEELGKAHLRAEQVDEGVKCFERAVELDPSKAYLFLDLSIFHTFRAMNAGGDADLLQRSLQSGKAAIKRYLDTNPIQPMRAYALGVQSKYEAHSGAPEQARALVQEAKTLDPYFSKATGAPNPDLFIPPGEISRRHRYLLRPF